MATAKDGVLVKPNTRSKRGGWIIDIRIKLPSSRESIRERTTIQAANKTEARNWGLRRKEEILRNGGTAVPVQGQEVPTLATFKDRFVTEHMKAERRKPSTIHEFESVFRNHLEPRFGATKLDTITLPDIQRLKGDLADACQPKTVNNILAALTPEHHQAVEWGVIEAAPKVRFVKVNRGEVDFYDFEEWEALRAAAHGLDPRIEVMVLLGRDAGLRRGEILGVEWSDFDFTRGKLHVQRAVWKGKVTLPKGGRDRWVPLTSGLRDALANLPRGDRDSVLYRDDGRPATDAVLHNWMRQAQRQAELPVTGNLHVLRHTFCTHLAMQGVPPKVIQSLAGHATLDMTMRYMHLVEGHDDAAIRLLDQPRGGDLVDAANEQEPAPGLGDVAVVERGTSEAQPGIAA